MSLCIRMRFRAAPSHPIDTHNSPRQHNTQHPRASAVSSHCRVPGSAWTGRPRITLERQRCGDGRRRGGSGDRGTDASDDDGGGGVDERGVACASRAQTRFSVSLRTTGSSSRGTRVWAGMGRRTLARTVALAAREGPPNPPVRAGPIRGMGRAVRSRAHTLPGQRWRPAFAEMEIASPARAQSLVSRQTRAQTDPHATRITRIWGSRWAVHKSKRSTLGSAGLNPAQHLRQCKHWLRQDRTSPACEEIGAVQLAMPGPAQHLPGKMRVLLSHEQTDTMRAHKRHLQLFAAHLVGRVPNISA